MADFYKALVKTLKHEGGYANNPKDSGGETYQGVARRWHPDWAGWLILDQIPNKAWNRTYEELDDYVAAFYQENFWNPYKLSKIASQQVANVLFDWFVNSGNEVKQVQTILRDQFGQAIKVDGSLGANTIAAINAVNPFKLVEAVVQARVEYYKNGVAQGWLDQSFLDGLVARAEDYLTLGKSQLVA